MVSEMQYFFHSSSGTGLKQFFKERCVSWHEGGKTIVMHCFLRDIFKREPNSVIHSEKTEAFATHLRDYIPYIVRLFSVGANCLL